MTASPAPEEPAAAAEEVLRSFAQLPWGQNPFNQDTVPLVVAELDRLRAELARAQGIVRAATAYVAYENGGGTRDGKWFERKSELFNALAAEVAAQPGDPGTEGGGPDL